MGEYLTRAPQEDYQAAVDLIKQSIPDARFHTTYFFQEGLFKRGTSGVVPDGQPIPQNAIKGRSYQPEEVISTTEMISDKGEDVRVTFWHTHDHTTSFIDSVPVAGNVEPIPK